eukprot:CAMPEP_0178412052 /NCGR_PEP_ID=MMETSP0689_2-20121128/21812_1 /TAXON_ID=160604 /ORGANISM="Amphidinium massartii, Strain CS-259" /LENGTH=573 /DNA_ID=CAMNT_0020033279 /DNA_START=40 /DNA_END=1761 /DNA_ORIENTATION=+
MATSRTLFVASAACFVGAVEAQRQPHHSWDWFYEDMCGCAKTQYEGCGLSTLQLFEDLTESYGLKLCEDTNMQGMSSPDQTAEGYDQDNLQQKIELECRARVQLKEAALKFKPCLNLGEQECKEKEPCEWMAQDDGCGIDEEKLLGDLVPAEFRNHPLVQNVLIQDACSAKPHEQCKKDPQCAWQQWHSRCVANDAVIFAAFMERPALFQIGEIAEHGAHCRGMHEHVWHGTHCWARHCHLEKGICTANSHVAENSAPNRTSILEMFDHMCHERAHWHHGPQEVQGTERKCPPGCHEVAVENADDAEHHHHHEFECRADPLPEDLPMVLENMDRVLAVYFTVLRSATMVHEMRCNSLDNDIQQCQTVAAEHADCRGLFTPNATEIFAWHHRQQLQQQNTPRNDAPQPQPQEQTAGMDVTMNNIMEHAAKADAGIGMNGPLNSIMQMASSSDSKEAFMQNFSSMLQNADADGTIQQIQEAAPDAIKGFRQMWQDTAPPKAAELAKPDAFQELQSRNDASHGILAIGLGSVVFAAICGGFAWGVLMSNRMRRDTRGHALLETQYMRQDEAQSGRV